MTGATSFSVDTTVAYPQLPVNLYVAPVTKEINHKKDSGNWKNAVKISKALALWNAMQYKYSAHLSYMSFMVGDVRPGIYCFHFIDSLMAKATKEHFLPG